MFRIHSKQVITMPFVSQFYEVPLMKGSVLSRRPRRPLHDLLLSARCQSQPLWHTYQSISMHINTYIVHSKCLTLYDQHKLSQKLFLSRRGHMHAWKLPRIRARSFWTKYISLVSPQSGNSTSGANRTLSTLVNWHQAIAKNTTTLNVTCHNICQAKLSMPMT